MNPRFIALVIGLILVVLFGFWMARWAQREKPTDFQMPDMIYEDATTTPRKFLPEDVYCEHYPCKG